MEKVRDLVKAVEFEVSKENGVAKIKAKDDNVYANILAEVNPLFTKATLKELDKTNEAFLDAGLEVARNRAIDIFKDDTNVKAIEIIVPFGTNKSDTATYSITKEKEFSIPGKDTKIKKSVVKLDVKKTGTKLSKSRIKALESDISEAVGLK